MMMAAGRGDCFFLSFLKRRSGIGIEVSGEKKKKGTDLTCKVACCLLLGRKWTSVGDKFHLSLRPRRQEEGVSSSRS